MKNNYQIVLFVITLLSPMVSAMQPMDESQLGEITGEGIGATFDNVVIHSGNYGDPDDFQIRYKLTENGPETLIFSELRFYRSGATPGQADSGGFFGTYDDPFFVGDLREISESYISSIDPEGDGTYVDENRTHVALYTGFPAADVSQLNRNFYSYSGKRFNAPSNVGSLSYYRGLPNGFFSGTPNVPLGNLEELTTQYEGYLAGQDARLDQATDKFDLHFRLDAITSANVNMNTDDQFIAFVDVEGARLYGTSSYIWSHSRQNEVLGQTEINKYRNNSAPVQADYGLAMAMTTGLRADVIRISADPRVSDPVTQEAAKASILELRDVDMYLPMGSVDQPMTISTVQYSQVQRGTWKNPTYLPASTQLRIEIAALPKEVQQAPQGNIYVQSLSFGDPNDEEVITGREDIYLRDASGNIIATVPDVIHRAFVPKTVIYNEQVDLYNKNNPLNEIPLIPNQNVIEIKGIEIQRMIITTQDL